MYFFWYFSSHLCWLPRYLCLNRSCLSYLLPSLPLSFWEATRPGGWEWVGVATAPGTSLSHGSTCGAERALGAAVGNIYSFYHASSLKKTPWRKGSSPLSLKGSSGSSPTSPQSLKPAMAFHTLRPLLMLFPPPGVLSSSLRTPIYSPRPRWNVTSPWKSSSIPHLSSSSILSRHGDFVSIL